MPTAAMTPTTMPAIAPALRLLLGDVGCDDCVGVTRAVTIEVVPFELATTVGVVVAIDVEASLVQLYHFEATSSCFVTAIVTLLGPSTTVPFWK